ncbi:MAG: EI24 domain-containing protein [bacterium]|jgi:CysZ protein
MFNSLVFAFGNLLHPRMLWLMVWPVLVAIGIWGVALFFMWAQLVLWLAEKLRAGIAYATFWVEWDSTDVAMFAAKLLVLLMLVPLVQFTALLILGVFGMPSMVEHVAARRFQALERRRGGSFAGSVINSIIAVLGLIALGFVSVPFWFFPPLWPVIPLLIFGWVNQRVLRYDALAEHASEEEMTRIFREQRFTLVLLGVILALVAYIPFVGLLAPVVFGLAFIHFLLEALQRSRGVPPIEGEVVRR